MLATFLYTLSSGMLVVLATGRPTTMARRFLQLVCLIALAVAVVPPVRFLLVGNTPRNGSWADPLGLVMTIGAVVAVLTVPRENQPGRTFRVVCALGGLAGLAAATAAAMGLPETLPVSGTATAFLIVGQVLAALLLGSITVAWLLGHAYLTATKMTLAPLSHFSRLLSWAVIARAVFACVSMVGAWLLWDESAGSGASFQLANLWLIASIRIGCGLVVVGVFAFMVVDCVRLRSTQSATGILYFASLLAYVGELANQQIVVECGWPL